MTDRPRVLVTLGRDLPDRSINLRLPISYVNTLLGADALPVLMPPGLDATAIQEFVADVDGLMLPGGVDPHPRHFGEDIHPLTLIDEPLDSLELAATAAAMRLRLPVLGICRGSQVINVAMGGSLIQHLDPSVIDHKPEGPLDRHVHNARLIEGTRLHSYSATSVLQVNSWHHQAIARVADGLRVAAVAEDGIIEAVEAIDPDVWIIGVQYHPEEMLSQSAHRALLTGFVAACRERLQEAQPA